MILLVIIMIIIIIIIMIIIKMIIIMITVDLSVALASVKLDTRGTPHLHPKIHGHGGTIKLQRL